MARGASAREIITRTAGFARKATAGKSRSGGLRKARERVYANPVHYTHMLGAALSGGTPVAVSLACETLFTQHAFAHIPPQTGVPVVDAMAVITEAGDLALWLVHRSATCGPIELDIRLSDFQARAQADLVTLAGDL
ncbi:MAG: hypothetical protein P1S60_10690 [Anaerolineae bacterium]|nr:hypothetical protein [Anaerolineae bacterium]